MDGLTCVNFCWRLGNFQACQSIWCSDCYTSNQEVTFKVRSRPIDESLEERFVDAWKVQWEKNKYCVGRRGDHLLTPFECDRCIFAKLKSRLPFNEAPKDKLLLAVIRRINLDALWSRESSTVH